MIDKEINKYLKENNITMSDLAKELDTTFNTVWRWCNGKSEPKKHTVAGSKMLKLLKVNNPKIK